MRGHFCGWLTVIIFVLGLCGLLLAQDAGSEAIVLVAGRSTVVQAPWPTVRVAVTDPKVADVQVLTPQQVLVQGLKVGTTDLILWSEDETQTWQRQVIVRLDLDTIRNRLQGLFPDAELTLSESGEVLVVRGLLRRADHVQQLKEYLEQMKTPYVNMTSLSGVQQVQLQVRLAEVSKAATKELGINWFGTGKDAFLGQRVGPSGSPLVTQINMGAAGGQDVTQSLPFVTGDSGIGASPAVSLFAGFPGANLEFFFQALAENQYMRILANPTLVALSGEEANFLAGGEFPIPVVQGSGAGGGNNQAITIQYKEFGVLLTFRPTVLGDGRIRLQAMQEVSQLSDVGALVMQGFSIPALTTRRAEATLELDSGQSFAMAGLLQNTDTAVVAALPGLGNLPVIGPLFRSVRYRNNETELVILVTAALVEPMSLAKVPPLPGATYTPPDDWELYAEGRLEGREPARLDPSSREWLKQMGLDELVGPGAWDTYEDQTYSSALRVAEATEQSRNNPDEGK